MQNPNNSKYGLDEIQDHGIRKADERYIELSQIQSEPQSLESNIAQVFAEDELLFDDSFKRRIDGSNIRADQLGGKEVLSDDDWNDDQESPNEDDESIDEDRYMYNSARGFNTERNLLQSQR